MFCPTCGVRETSSGQFCRACGSDLRMLRVLMQRPDKITETALAARDEIGRSIAHKVREMQTMNDLAEFTDSVLPQIERFLESPAERRMRRMRAGMVVGSIGVSCMLAFGIAAAVADQILLVPAALSSIVFFIGLGIFLNGYTLTEVPMAVPDSSDLGLSQKIIDEKVQTTDDLKLPAETAEEAFAIGSVVEPTTRQLKSDSIR